METPHNPFPTFEQDGFQLAVIEQGDTRRPLAMPLVSDERRFAVQSGDLVKLIFEYREPMKAKGSGAEYGAEHMWVKVAEYGDGYLIGELDSSPQYTQLLKSGDAVPFHPKHIIAFWDDEQNG
jgi:hypothetical protein